MTDIVSTPFSDPGHLRRFSQYPAPGVVQNSRLAIQVCPWMGDWFTSFSPRNNINAGEGPWGHWVDLAISILQHPATQVAHPEAHAAASYIESPENFRICGDLTTDQLSDLFPTE